VRVSQSHWDLADFRGIWIETVCPVWNSLPLSSLSPGGQEDDSMYEFGIVVYEFKTINWPCNHIYSAKRQVICGDRIQQDKDQRRLPSWTRLMSDRSRTEYQRPK
jgi:hypothetical protein